MTDIEDFAAGDDHEFDKINDEGHAKWCDKWLNPVFDCSCPVRWRDMPDPHEGRAMDAFMDILDGSDLNDLAKVWPDRFENVTDEYADWDDDNPPRTPKGAKSKMGRDGDSAKLIAKIIGKGEEYDNDLPKER